MEDRTTLQIPRPILHRLQKFGLKGETYAEVLTRLMDDAEARMYAIRLQEIAKDKEHLLDDDQVP